MTWLNILGGGAALVALVGAVYGALRYLDHRIDKRIQDESFMRKLATALRPAVIFDENGSILIDQGAVELIENIEVRHDPGTRLPTEIVVSPRRHLVHAPFIQPMESELFDVTPSRGRRFVWSLRLEYRMTDDAFDGRRRFRMEIIP